MTRDRIPAGAMVAYDSAGLTGGGSTDNRSPCHDERRLVVASEGPSGGGGRCAGGKDNYLEAAPCLGVRGKRKSSRTQEACLGTAFS